MSKIKNVCPECGEETKPARIPPIGWALTVPGKYLRNAHLDGTPLCPVMSGGGYHPALPERRKT